MFVLCARYFFMSCCMLMTFAFGARYMRSWERWNRHSFIMFERLVAVRMFALTYYGIAGNSTMFCCCLTGRPRFVLIWMTTRSKLATSLTGCVQLSRFICCSVQRSQPSPKMFSTTRHAQTRSQLLGWNLCLENGRSVSMTLIFRCVWRANASSGTK